MRATPFLAALAGLAFGVTHAVAASPDEDRVKATLEKRLPEAKIEAVHKSSIAGLYEVVFPTEMAYADASGDMLFLGRMVDTRTRIDVGTERWNALHAVPLANLPLELAIKTVRGDGHRQLAVFADPLCPFCQQLEQNLAGVTDVTIYTFLLPLEGVHPGATVRSRQIWCAPDRSEAWTKWMLARVEPGKGDCGTDPVARVLDLAQHYAISGTPTLLFASGQRLSGALPRPDLERMLSGQPLAPPQAN